MNRLSLRKYIRFLVTEYTEKPEGFIKDTSEVEIALNDLINMAQEAVELDLAPFIPQYFRKIKLLSLQQDKSSYDVEDDFLIPDFLLFENVFHNESDKRPQGLLYVDPDQIFEYTTVGEEGDPKVWTYEGAKSVAFYPIPSADAIDRYKAYYFRKLPDLNQDTDHNPAGFKITATTIAFVAATRKITDSGNGLAGFKDGDTIEVSGSVANDGIYTVVTGGIADYMVVAEALVDGVAGPSVTIEGPGKYAIPDIPTVAHTLIAIRVVIELQIAKEQGAVEIMQLYEKQKQEVIKLLEYKPSLRTDRRLALTEITR
jgi:hypothetical protein